MRNGPKGSPRLQKRWLKSGLMHCGTGIALGSRDMWNSLKPSHFYSRRVLLLATLGVFAASPGFAGGTDSVVCSGRQAQGPNPEVPMREVSSILNFSGSGFRFRDPAAGAVRSYDSAPIGHLWEDESPFSFARTGGPFFQGPDPFSLQSGQPMGLNPQFMPPSQFYPPAPLSMGVPFGPQFY